MLKKQSKFSGFTLTELMITVSIAGILTALAMPSFISTIRSNQLTTYSNELVAAFNFARSEAIKRGRQVTITREGVATDSQVWEAGWWVFVDVQDSVSNPLNDFWDDGDSNFCETNSDGVPIEDCLLKVHAPLASNYRLRTGTTSYKDYASFLPNGMKGNSGFGDTFTLCYDSSGSTESRIININFVGRSRVSTGTVSQCPLP
jgi:type IV fimbrial biogenesis protein FimT